MSTQNSFSSRESNRFKPSNAGTIITALSTALILSLIAISYLLVKNASSNTLFDRSNCLGVCCDSVKFNAISEDDLDTMICNYRNNDWWKTSNFFNQNQSFSYAEWKVQRRNASMYDSSYNARYMDVSLASLENYLCTIKRNCKNNATFIRLYYIRYGSECFNPNFANKHSLAMIPLDSNLNEIPNAKDCYSGNDSKSLIFVSHIANHNEICPPEPPLNCGKRLYRLDTAPSTY